MRRTAPFAILLLIPALALPAMAQKQKDNSKNGQSKGGSTAAVTPVQSAPQAVTTDPSYKIGPSDVLIITVWDQDKLSATVPVRPDGMISLPLINDVMAAGKTPMELKQVLTEKLSQGLVKDPQVTVVVSAINSQRVYVLGQVARAGAYPLLPGMTVLQAISSAGGLGQYAKETKITILRTENGKQLRFEFNYKEVLNGKGTDQNIVLKPGDTINVPG